MRDILKIHETYILLFIFVYLFIVQKDMIDAKRYFRITVHLVQFLDLYDEFFPASSKYIFFTRKRNQNRLCLIVTIDYSADAYAFKDYESGTKIAMIRLCDFFFSGTQHFFLPVSCLFNCRFRLRCTQATVDRTWK